MSTDANKEQFQSVNVDVLVKLLALNLEVKDFAMKQISRSQIAVLSVKFSCWRGIGAFLKHPLWVCRQLKMWPVWLLLRKK